MDCTFIVKKMTSVEITRPLRFIVSSWGSTTSYERQSLPGFENT